MSCIGSTIGKHKSPASPICRDWPVQGIGNPFGAVIEDILVEEGAPYRHYCAQQVRSLLSSGKATVVEVGGGFGGMAYYLLRDAIGTRYIDFDVPETIALASIT